MASLGRPCDYCGRLQLVASRGREYCLSCADPISDAPLVPVSWPPNRILQIRSAYKRVAREYTEDNLPPIPKYATDPKRKPKYFLIPMIHEVQRKPPAGGAPKFFTDEDLDRLLSQGKTPTEIHKHFRKLGRHQAAQILKRMRFEKKWTHRERAKAYEELHRAQALAAVTLRSVYRRIADLKRRKRSSSSSK